MANILILPAGTETALEIYKSLFRKRNITLFGADTDQLNPLFFILPANQCINICSFYSEDFFEQLQQIIKDKNIDYIYPTHDALLLKFAGIETIGQAQLIISNKYSIEVTSSKKSLYDLMPDISPRVYSSLDQVQDYPVFIKPACGRGSIDAHKINNKEELAFYSSRIDNPVITEYLSGTEHTVDCLSNLKGELLQYCIRERIKIHRGITHIGETVENQTIRELALKINNLIKPNGGWFFQVKLNQQGIPKLLEINLRVSGTMCLTRMAGLNIPYLTIRLFQKDNIKDVPSPTLGIQVSRHLTEEYNLLPSLKRNTIIWDLDDTIWQVQEGKKEPQVFQDVIELIKDLGARGFKQAILTKTRFGENLVKLIEQYQLQTPNFNIQLVSALGRKSSRVQEYMDNGILPDANDIVFIDDSFAEREDMKKVFKDIKVFDTNTIVEEYKKYIERSKEYNG